MCLSSASGRIYLSFVNSEVSYMKKKIQEYVDNHAKFMAKGYAEAYQMLNDEDYEAAYKRGYDLAVIKVSRDFATKKYMNRELTKEQIIECFPALSMSEIEDICM